MYRSLCLKSSLKWKKGKKHVFRWYHSPGSRLELPLDSGTAEMLCGIQTNNPNAIFTWLKDGQPITRTPVFYKDDGRVLVLPNFTPADNGKYTCVTNDKSMSSSSTDIQYVDPGKNFLVRQRTNLKVSNRVHSHT